MQSYSSLIRLRLIKFSTEFDYDPDLVLNALFDSDSTESLGWVAAVVVAGLAVVGVISAVLVSPKLRQAVFPFANRVDQHHTTVLVEGELGPKNATASSPWSAGLKPTSATPAS